MPTKMEDEYDFASLYGCTPLNVTYINYQARGRVELKLCALIMVILHMLYVVHVIA